MLALADANSFYAQCECVYNPQLLGKPVIVLSNNDGCIVSRSPEAKAIGIKMGVPFFKAQALVDRYNVQVFSSNYALYGDLSHRIMTVLSYFTPNLEIYSIDEAFLDLSGFRDRPLTDYANTIRNAVSKWTGISVSIGIGPTKVLAKLANRVAKLHPQFNGIFDFAACDQPNEILNDIAVEEIWGVGRGSAKWLRTRGITTALQLRDTYDGLIQRKMGVGGLRLLQELRGISCLPLDLCPAAKRETCVSRSFGQPVETLLELREAISTYTARAAQKLRWQQQAATRMQVFARTSLFDDEAYSNSVGVDLPVATNITPVLLQFALKAAETLFCPGVRYKKAGVIMMGLVPESCIQGNLLVKNCNTERSRKLMDAIDAINARFGTSTLKFAAEGLNPAWQMKASQRSPRYTTQWTEIPVARASNRPFS
jgi:DNA polymerase V